LALDKLAGTLFPYQPSFYKGWYRK